MEGKIPDSVKRPTGDDAPLAVCDHMSITMVTEMMMIMVATMLLEEEHDNGDGDSNGVTVG